MTFQKRGVYSSEAKIIDDRKFQEYLAGHLPTIQRQGVRIVARTRSPYVAMGERPSDVIVIQEWPDRQASGMLGLRRLPALDTGA